MGRGGAWKVVHKAGIRLEVTFIMFAPKAASKELCSGLEPESWCCSVLLYVLLDVRIKSLSARWLPSRQSSQ